MAWWLFPYISSVMLSGFSIKMLIFENILFRWTMGCLPKSALPSLIHQNGQGHQALSDSGLYWPWSMTVCPKTVGHLSVIIQKLCIKEEETPSKMYKDILAENKCTKKVAGRLTFDLLTQRYLAPSFHLPFEYEVRRFYIENIHSYSTRNKGLFMYHNDLDLQIRGLKLYVCLPYVM